MMVMMMMVQPQKPKPQPQQIMCGVCGALAIIDRVSFQFDGRTYIDATHHHGGARHSWITFEPDKFLVPPEQKPKPKRRLPNPQYVLCPKCSQRGRINEYHSRGSNNVLVPPKLRFYIKHEALDGFWGKEGKQRMRKYRRCYFSAAWADRLRTLSDLD